MTSAVLTILTIEVIILIVSRELGNPFNEIRKFYKYSIASAKDFVDKIDSLGYFKYAEQKDIGRLKQNHLESFDPEGSWGGIWDDDTGLPLDFRYHSCDGEDLFEPGGFTAKLKEMGPIFQKIGLVIVVNHHYEEWDAEHEWLNHEITINGTEYVIFKNYQGYNGWGESPKRFAEILNKELEKQNIDERVYLINGGNDGFLILLNDELYNYFYSTFKNIECKPLKVNEWVKYSI